LIRILDKNQKTLRVSDPVIIHPELTSATNLHTKPASTKSRRFHNPPGSPQATGSLKHFWAYLLR